MQIFMLWFRLGHLDSRTSIQRVISVTFSIALAYSLSQVTDNFSFQLDAVCVTDFIIWWVKMVRHQVAQVPPPHYHTRNDPSYVTQLRVTLWPSLPSDIIVTLLVLPGRLPPYLHLATSEMWCWSGGRGILKQNCLCGTVLCAIIMVHKGTSSSLRSVDCIGFWSCLV